jgi:DNA-binding response OmpR family regulator
MKLIVIEDEKELANSIVDFIKRENYTVDIVNDFPDARDRINLYEYDCALIDLMLPGGTGLDLIRLLKARQPGCGIIIITAKDTLDEKIKGLDLGADDYLTKPFYLAELNARVNSVLRRRNFEGKNEIRLNEIIVYVSNHEVKVHEKEIPLTRTEFNIFLFFISNKEKVLTKESIVEHVWGNDSNIFDNFDFVYTHIKNLRKKIIDAGGKDYIKSVYGIGYKFSSI